MWDLYKFMNHIRVSSLFVIVLFSIQVGGCAIPALERDEFYPADWPDIVGAGQNCRGIEGAFSNKGVVGAEADKIHDIWFTDLFAINKKDTARADAMRACDRVTLKLETYPHPWNRDVLLWRLLIDPSRKNASDPPDGYEHCESISLPRGLAGLGLEGGVPMHESGFAQCVNGHLQYFIGDFVWYFGLASDETLLVKVFVGNLNWIPYTPIIWYSNRTYWARFGRLP